MFVVSFPVTGSAKRFVNYPWNLQLAKKLTPPSKTLHSGVRHLKANPARSTHTTPLTKRRRILKGVQKRPPVDFLIAHRAVIRIIANPQAQVVYGASNVRISEGANYNQLPSAPGL